MGSHPKAHTTMKTITLVALTFLSFTFIFSGRLEASFMRIGEHEYFLAEEGRSCADSCRRQGFHFCHTHLLNIASSHVSICRGILESLGYKPRTHFGHKHTHNFGKGCFYQAGHDWYHARGNGEMCHSGHENGTPWRRVCACYLPRN